MPTEVPPLTYEELFEVARRISGRTLLTITGRRFRVGTYRDSIVFTPESTGRGQSDGRAAGERFVERYNEIRSLRPGDYSKTVRNASYYAALVAAIVRRPDPDTRSVLRAANPHRPRSRQPAAVHDPPRDARGCAPPPPRAERRRRDR
jgi:hypothetical protein